MIALTPDIAILMLGACLGGFASGLTGFGYGMVALGIWLHALPPHVAAPLSVLCSVASQLLTLPRVWPTIAWQRAAPFIFAGVAGIPIGAELLGLLDPTLFKRVLGACLAVYAGFLLLVDVRWTTRWGGETADVGIGFFGGILGGLAGLSGSILVVWSTLRGWGKDEKRGIFQAFNFSMLTVSGLTHAWQGLHTPRVGAAVIIAVPLSLVMAALGHQIYQRLSATRFDRIVLWLLLFAGLGLLLGPGPVVA
jgi:uncharacterized protein